MARITRADCDQCPLNDNCPNECIVVLEKGQPALRVMTKKKGGNRHVTSRNRDYAMSATRH